MSALATSARSRATRASAFSRSRAACAISFRASHLRERQLGGGARALGFGLRDRAAIAAEQRQTDADADRRQNPGLAARIVVLEAGVDAEGRPDRAALQLRARASPTRATTFAAASFSVRWRRRDGFRRRA